MVDQFKVSQRPQLFRWQFGKKIKQAAIQSTILLQRAKYFAAERLLGKIEMK